MAKAKVSRKELLKKTDEFITFSSRVVTFVTKRSRQFGYAGIVLACLIIIYLGINTYLKYVNKKGQNVYNMAYYTIAKNIGSEKNEEDLKKSEELFNQVLDKYGISKVARLALPELAYMKFLGKDYDEAIARYLDFLEKTPDDPYKSLAIMALAVCQEEKGAYDQAIQSLEQIRSGPDDFFKEQALLSLARVYRLIKKDDKSDEIIKEFIDKFKTSPFLPIAEAHLKS